MVNLCCDVLPNAEIVTNVTEMYQREISRCVFKTVDARELSPHAAASSYSRSPTVLLHSAYFKCRLSDASYLLSCTDENCWMSVVVVVVVGVSGVLFCFFSCLFALPRAQLCLELSPIYWI